MTAKDFQARLAGFIAQQERALDTLTKGYEAEKARLDLQIVAAKDALAKVADPAVTDALDALTKAGIQLSTT